MEAVNGIASYRVKWANKREPVPAMADLPTVLILKVELESVRPKIWRRIEVDGWLKLACFHQVLQAAIGWRGLHSHEFHIRKKIFTRPGPEYSMFGIEVEDERKFRLDKLLAAKESLLYIHDLADQWRHKIRVEEAEVRRGVSNYARVLAGEGACPLEAMGGVSGYLEWLEHYRENPDDPWVQQSLEETNQAGFHPDLFDLRATNATIGRMAANRWIGK
jgi:hypothetical protein